MSAPIQVLTEFGSTLPRGRALDLACGSGRNAIWLAERGWDVTAVDLMPTVSPQDRVHIVQADLEKGGFAVEAASWDLVLMSYYLQRELFPPAIAGLRPGGLLIAVCLLESPAHPGRFRLRAGEMRTLLSGGEILHMYEGPSRDGHSHLVSEVVLRHGTAVS